ncbi:MAG: (d)CMP kinase [Oscillospiraceae bacterium]|nr:(d)CMP kinase [Oscillospiraceae bacterium]
MDLLSRGKTDQKNKFFAVAIDGPSGAGKSTLAKALAEKLGFLYLDTGALYRTVGLYVYEAGLRGDETEKIGELVKSGEIKIEVAHEGGEQKVFLNGSDVSGKIRGSLMSKYASDVSKIPEVREFLLNTQKDAAKKNDIIMDGRDIGTVILPGADVKIFLTASPDVRARRRFAELGQKGEKVGYDAVLREINERDAQDSSRAAAPLKPAGDAIILNNSECASPEDTADKALDIIKEILPDVCIR